MNYLPNNLNEENDNNTKQNTYNLKDLITDSTNTAIYSILDPIEWTGKALTEIQKAIRRSVTEWNFWKKIWKVPVSLVASPLMAIEWAAETLFHYSYNVTKNIAHTLTNPFTNFRKPIEWTFDNDEKKNPKMRLASLF